MVFQSGLVASHTEAHIAIPRRDVQRLEQADEVGIGSIVEDHEARVGGVLAAERLERDGVRVPARIVIGLENVDIVVGGEEPGRKQPADARTNDRDSHVTFRQITLRHYPCLIQPLQVMFCMPVPFNRMYGGF